jgi:hypothetical protein
MGLLVYDALVINKAAEFLSRRYKCLTLGVPTLTFRPEDFIQAKATRPCDFNEPFMAPFEDATQMFMNLGFGQVDALDISNYEGANIVDDLNSPTLTDRVAGGYDLIYDSGTLEHIFDAPTALRSLVKLLSPGGIIVHATPANGFMDHGLWQVSPDLYRQFYHAAGFTLLSSALFVFGKDDVYALPADENMYRTYGRKHISQVVPEGIAVFAAQKSGDDRSSVFLSLQDYYADMHGSERVRPTSRFFLPYGQLPRDEISVPKQVERTLGSRLGAAWKAFTS